jgi:hypothetical protein
MPWTIDELPNQPVGPLNDWHAWLKSPEGTCIKIQIPSDVTRERANEMLAELIGIKVP